ncbi:MAG: TetR/AcrR family transcriptional regulator [Terracidiphilus sp.]
MSQQKTTSRQIYDYALRLLESEGPQAVTMRRVANEIGITPMAIYHHFASREAMLSEIVDNEFEKLAGFFSRPRSHRSFEAKVVHMMDAYVDYALAHPRIFDYVFSHPRPGARRYPADFRPRRSPTLNILADELAALMKLKRLKREDVWELAIELWAHTHGYLMLYRAGRFNLREAEFRELIHRSLRRLLYGLAR